MMKRIGLACMLSIGLAATNAWASIVLSPSDADFSGNQNSQAAINAFLVSLGVPTPPLYKSNVGGPEEGAFAGSYTTVFQPTVGPLGATITWDGGNLIEADPVWLVVKDGNSTPAWYAFELDWNGKETIELQNFWPGNGSISHVAIHGTHVPDGGLTLVLLGSALVGLETVRRRLRA